ncbi:glycosyltransferase [Blastococcus sp. MG754427]|uniref:glycosyltransferase n=1 Tax=unclassified Blastococcus TaxID=2619396 RepID=UPI0035AB936F
MTRAGKVIFLGALEERKGVPLLLASWPHVRVNCPDATLTVIGSGPLEPAVREWASGRDEVSLRSNASRKDIHRDLLESSVLVLLSQPERYWREQIGLPILEGISHGCRIVTTDQTGIADWLQETGHEVVPHTADPSQAAGAIEAALHAGPWNGRGTLPSTNGRASAAAWMFA